MATSIVEKLRNEVAGESPNVEVKAMLKNHANMKMYVCVIRDQEKQ